MKDEINKVISDPPELIQAGRFAIWLAKSHKLTNHYFGVWQADFVLQIIKIRIFISAIVNTNVEA